MNTRNRAWQYLEKLFEYCIKENRCPDLLAYLFDKQQFKKILAGHEKSSIEEAYTHFVNTIIGKINGKLFFGGNELAVGTVAGLITFYPVWLAENSLSCET